MFKKFSLLVLIVFAFVVFATACGGVDKSMTLEHDWDKNEFLVTVPKGVSLSQLRFYDAGGNDVSSGFAFKRHYESQSTLTYVFAESFAENFNVTVVVTDGQGNPLPGYESKSYSTR